jgi:hypothetical protein
MLKVVFGFLFIAVVSLVVALIKKNRCRHGDLGDVHSIITLP